MTVPSKRDVLLPQAFALWLENKSFRDIGAALDITKDTAYKYVCLALQENAASLDQDDRATLVRASLLEKQDVMRLARAAFDDAQDTLLNRGSYLNTILAASNAKDKVQGLLIEQHQHGGAIRHEHTIDMSGFSDDELRSFIARATGGSDSGAGTP